MVMMSSAASGHQLQSFIRTGEQTGRRMTFHFPLKLSQGKYRKLQQEKLATIEMTQLQDNRGDKTRVHQEELKQYRWCNCTTIEVIKQGYIKRNLSNIDGATVRQ
jgi:hypothetical protein